MPLATAIGLGEERKLYRVLGVKDEVAGVGSGLLYRGYPHHHFKRQGRKRRQTCSGQGFLEGGLVFEPVFKAFPFKAFGRWKLDVRSWRGAL